MVINTVGGNIAMCVLRWLYAQVQPLLEALKAIILAMIGFVDAQILWLKALLAQYDIVKMMEEASWAIVEAILNSIRDTLLNLPTGPLKDLCPEFYQLITDPALMLFDAAVGGLTIWREKYKNVVSFMDEIEALFQHWDAIKAELVTLVESIDDAIYWAMKEAAGSVS